MPVPSTPSYAQMPNNLSELLKIHRDGYRKFSQGLTNLTKVTKLTSKRVKDVAKVANTVKKTANNAKKITDFLKKGKFKQVNPKLGNAVGFALNLASIGLSLLTINQIGKLQEVQLRIDGIVQRDLGDAFTRAINNTLTIRKLREEFNTFVSQYKQDKDKLGANITANLQNLIKIRELSEAAKKQANDALYEAREGRKKVEAKVAENFNTLRDGLQQLFNDVSSQNAELANRTAEARKLGNDALYEARTNNQQLTSEINQKFQAARKLGNDALYEARANRQKLEANFGQQLNSLRRNLNLEVQSIERKSAAQVNQLFNNSKGLINNALTQARSAQAEARSLRQQVNQNKNDISRLNIKNPDLNIEPTVRKLIANSPQIQGLVAALKAAGVKVDGIERYLLPALDTAVKTVGYKAQLIDGRVTKLEQDIKLKDPGVTRVENSVNNLKTRINTAETNIGTNKIEIDKLKTRVRENQQVDTKQFNDLKNSLALIPPLIARVPNDVAKRVPRPLTPSQIESATGSAICKSTSPGGCMNRGLNNTADTINRNTDKWGKNLFDKINAGANAAQLALLQKIDGKLGAKIVGGISGQVVKNFERINKFADWLRVDRILNVLTWVNTTHNAWMLSSSITNTLFGAIDNVANIFFKDINGVDIDSKKAVSTYFDNMAKSIFGVKEWQEMKTTMKKYNRIYQTGANIINSVRSIVDSTRNVTEYIAENTGKIGNALMKYGAIAANAFPKLPEQVNAQSLWVQRLNNLEEAASGIEMVTGEVLQITENVNEIKKQTEEFNKGVESLEPKVRKDNKPVKEREDKEVIESQSPFISPDKERSA